jgi:hypothetical protein
MSPLIKNRSSENPSGAGDLIACHPAGRKREAGDKIADPTAEMFFITSLRPGNRYGAVTKGSGHAAIGNAGPID